MTVHASRISPLILTCLLAACGSNNSQQQPDGGNPGGNDGGSGAGSINGMVTDIGTGARMSGVSVSGGGKSATTDAKGEFTLSGLAAGQVNLTVTKSGYAPGYATAKSGDQAQAVVVSLKKEGSSQTYNASAALTLSEKTEAGPYALILQPNSLDTTATSLSVVITPLDPTKERKALPGSLLTSGSSPSLLMPVTFAEFTIRDPAGNRVNLKSSASALVELPIPPPLRATYPQGTKIHCYAYDAAAGAWQDFVEGTVQISSVDGTSPVLAASIRHFSWYGGAPQGNDCVDVYVNVVSAVDGKPLPNARVEATPGTTAYSDTTGSALVRSALGAPGSTYTAYQTGFDVDGSLTGIPGAKYIEFGQVQEDLVGLVKVPCSGAAGSGRPDVGPAQTSASRALVGTKASPLVIKVGVVKNLLYEATATLVAGSSGIGGLTVILKEGVPGPDGKLVNGAPTSGAKISITEVGGASTSLAEIAAGTGVYAATAGVTVNPGKSYLLAIDADGNGSIDGTSTVVALGQVSWSNPTEGADVAAAGLIASWADTGSAAANPAYAPVYQAVIVSSGQYPDAAIYTGTDRQFHAKSSFNVGADLAPGSYTASLLGFSGFNPQAGGGLQLSNNIVGTGITGAFYSFAAAPTLQFTVH